MRAHFADIVRGGVDRYELPGLGALNFVMQGALGGGVTRSLVARRARKESELLLLELEIPDRQSQRVETPGV